MKITIINTSPETEHLTQYGNQLFTDTQVEEIRSIQ